jgi:hypothetical protein
MIENLVVQICNFLLYLLLKMIFQQQYFIKFMKNIFDEV